MGGVVRGREVDGAVRDPAQDRVPIRRGADGGVHVEAAAEAHGVLLGEHGVVRHGLAPDVEAPSLGPPQPQQLVRGGDVAEDHPGPIPGGQALEGLLDLLQRGAHRGPGPGLVVGPRRALREPLLVLRVDRDAGVTPEDLPEARGGVQRRVRGGARHVDLHRRDPIRLEDLVDHRGLDVEAPVDPGLPGEARPLGLQPRGGGGGGAVVGHVEDRGHPAGQGRAGAVGDPFLVAVARLTEVGVRIHQAGDHEPPRAVDHVRRRGRRCPRGQEAHAVLRREEGARPRGPVGAQPGRVVDPQHPYSHSMVAGGLVVTSYQSAPTPSKARASSSMASRRSQSMEKTSAVIASVESTGRTT